MKNTWMAKIIRIFTSVLSVSEDRSGNCLRCGACCKLPNRCIFLKEKARKAYCLIHKIRPLNCRKYPRCRKEQITEATCGYRFR